MAGFGKEKKLNYERDMITGLAKGESKGRTEAASAIAVRMLSDGMPLETVAKYSGLSEEEVRKLSQSKLG